MAMVKGYRAAVRNGWGAGLTLLSVAPWPLLAQATYTVFPAAPAVASRQPEQPTGQDGNARVTLAAQEQTIASVARALTKQAHLQLAYDANDPLLEHRITVSIVNLQLMDALQMALRNTGLVAKLTSDGQMVVIRPKSLSSVATSRGVNKGGAIAGRVTDSASGGGLKGASVTVAGTTLSAITSDSGNFTLRDVPAGEQVLSVKLFGYRPAERIVTVVDSQRTMIRIALVSVPTVLSGVVTTATGVQSKVEVGNDITTLNVDSVRSIAPITSVTDLLETRVPGLTVLHSSGTPGDPSRLRLRGVGSIQGDNDPVIIIDGVRVYSSQSNSRNNNLAHSGGQPPLTSGQAYTAPSPLDQIDPANIETIEVLKGPSATAIYGSDAASGVIVITTKHGRSGPTHWNLDLGQGVNWLPGSWPVNYFRFGTDGSGISSYGGGQTSPLCNWNQPRCTLDSVIAFQALNDPRYTVFSHGSNQQADLTVSGGSSALTYSITGSGTGNVGYLKLPESEQQRWDSLYDATLGPVPHALVRPDNYTDWGVSGALTALPSPRLRVTLQSSLLNSTQQQGSLQGAIAQLAGDYISPSGILGEAGKFGGVGGVLIAGDVERATSNAVTQTNGLSLHWQAASWLPLDLTGGINTIQRTDNTYVPFGVSATGLGSGFSDTTGSYGLGRGVSHDQTLTIGTAIPLKIVTLALGGNSFTESTADFSIFTNQLAPGVSTPTDFLCPVQSGCNGTQSTAGASTYGWYVEPRLNVASKFFVSPGFRLDGGSGGRSTTSSGLNGLTAFPKVDLSYVAVNRQGRQPLWGIVTLFRPRLALGMAGTQPFPEQKLRLYNSTDFTRPGNASPYVPSQAYTVAEGQGCRPILSLDGSTLVPAVCLGALGNTQLRPERTRELEAGGDLDLWGDRVSVTYTQYTKQTQDAILDIPVAPSATGVTSMSKNIGVIRNTGTELTLNVLLLQSRLVSWNIGGNLSNDNNLVVRLNPGQPAICFGTQGSSGACNGTRIVAGYPVFGLWEQPIASFADVNHDGIIESSEIRYGDSSVYVGQPNPKYQMNINTGVTFFNGHLGVNATLAYVNGLTQNPTGSAQIYNLANAPNTSLAAQAALAADQVTPIGLIQTVNTFRFNDLSINWIVPRSVANWFRAPHMVLALQGSNLALHTNYRGKDPDVNAFATVTAGDETVDLGQLPEPRTWWLKLSLGN